MRKKIWKENLKQNCIFYLTQLVYDENYQTWNAF